MKRYLILGVLLLAAALGLALRNNARLRADRSRLEDNQRALIDAAAYYETQAGTSAASVERLTLTVAEVKAQRDDLAKTCRELRVKVRRLEAASTTATQTEIEAHAPLRDTIVIVKNEPIRTQTFRWADSWITVDGLLRRDSVVCRIRSIDTLRQIVHRVPRKFLFIRWGTKAIRQEIASSNPHTKIVYSEYIEMKRRRHM